MLSAACDRIGHDQYTGETTGGKLPTAEKKRHLLRMPMQMDRPVPYDPRGNLWAQPWRESQVTGDGRPKQRPNTAHVAGVRGVRGLRDAPRRATCTEDIDLLRQRLQCAQAYNARLQAYNDRLLGMIHALTRQLAVK